jgi:hypothetical protein
MATPARFDALVELPFSIREQKPKTPLLASIFDGAFVAKA